MTSEEYFVMIMYILMGLTFVAFVLLFLYIIYDEKEDGLSSKTALTKNILNTFLFYLLRILDFL